MAYTVRSGDNLSAIARAHGINLLDLVAANRGIDPNLIRPGQSINIPGKRFSDADRNQAAVDVAATDPTGRFSATGVPGGGTGGGTPSFAFTPNIAGGFLGSAPLVDGISEDTDVVGRFLNKSVDRGTDVSDVVSRFLSRNSPVLETPKRALNDYVNQAQRDAETGQDIVGRVVSRGQDIIGVAPVQDILGRRRGEGGYIRPARTSTPTSPPVRTDPDDAPDIIDRIVSNRIDSILRGRQITGSISERRLTEAVGMTPDESITAGVPYFGPVGQISEDAIVVDDISDLKLWAAANPGANIYYQDPEGDGSLVAVAGPKSYQLLLNEFLSGKDLPEEIMGILVRAGLLSEEDLFGDVDLSFGGGGRGRRMRRGGRGGGGGVGRRPSASAFRTGLYSWRITA